MKLFADLPLPLPELAGAGWEKTVLRTVLPPAVEVGTFGTVLLVNGFIPVINSLNELDLLLDPDRDTLSAETARLRSVRSLRLLSVRPLSPSSPLTLLTVVAAINWALRVGLTRPILE